MVAQGHEYSASLCNHAACASRMCYKPTSSPCEARLWHARCIACTDSSARVHGAVQTLRSREILVIRVSCELLLQLYDRVERMHVSCVRSPENAWDRHPVMKTVAFAVLKPVENGAPRRIEPLIRLHRPISPKAYPISHTALTVPAPSLYVCARRCTCRDRVAYSPPHARHPAL